MNACRMFPHCNCREHTTHLYHNFNPVSGAGNRYTSHTASSVGASQHWSSVVIDAGSRAYKC